MSANDNLRHFVEHIAALHKDGFINEAESVVHANELRVAEAMRARCETIIWAYADDQDKTVKASAVAKAIASLKGNGEGK